METVEGNVVVTVLVVLFLIAGIIYFLRGR